MLYTVSDYTPSPNSFYYSRLSTVITWLISLAHGFWRSTAKATISTTAMVASEYQPIPLTCPNTDRRGDRYVWLVPVYTYNAAEAAVRFDLSIQEKAHSGWPDLAKGAGGSYRYLRAAADPGNPDKITKLILKRSGSEVKSFDAAYSGHTGDINRGRGLDYLYLLWATRAAY